MWLGANMAPPRSLPTSLGPVDDAQVALGSHHAGVAGEEALGVDYLGRGVTPVILSTDTPAQLHLPLSAMRILPGAAG